MPVVIPNGALLIEEVELKMHRPLAFALIFSIFMFASCDKINSIKQSNTPEEAVKRGDEKIVKNFDVDHLASDNLRSEIKTLFKADSTSDLVETGLKSKGFECRIDPSNKNERGCDKMETRDGCIYMSVVKTLPFNPDGAQIIKVCDVGQ